MLGIYKKCVSGINKLYSQNINMIVPMNPSFSEASWDVYKLRFFPEIKSRTNPKLDRARGVLYIIVILNLE